MLTVAADGVPILEQPFSTLLHRHDCFQEMVRLLAKRTFVAWLQAWSPKIEPRGGGGGGGGSQRHFLKIKQIALRYVPPTDVDEALWTHVPEAYDSLVNFAWIRALDLGPIRKRQHKSLVKTAHPYVDKSGKKRYQGSKELRSTQFLAIICCAIPPSI